MGEGLIALDINSSVTFRLLGDTLAQSARRQGAHGLHSHEPGQAWAQHTEAMDPSAQGRYRKQRTDKNNIFAIVEIKFEGDKIDGKQFKQYDDLLVEAAKTKTKGNPVRLNNEAVRSGGHLSLFRCPEDKARAEGADEKAQRKPPRNSKTR